MSVPWQSQMKAGGIGVNLQAAQVVILVEPQFKPSTEWQAIARVHCMGQSRPVVVHRLLARDTVDEHLVALINTINGKCIYRTNPDYCFATYINYKK